MRLSTSALPRQFIPTIHAPTSSSDFTSKSGATLQDAIAQYQKVISVTQNDVWNNAKLRDNAWVNMGYAYRDMGDPVRAAASFAAAENQRREFLRSHKK